MLSDSQRSVLQQIHDHGGEITIRQEWALHQSPSGTKRFFAYSTIATLRLKNFIVTIGDGTGYETGWEDRHGYKITASGIEALHG